MRRVLIALAGFFVGMQTANAAVVYNSWTSNEGHSGNYVLTVSQAAAGALDFSFTVEPWNAEALGLFVNLGNVDLGSVSLSSIAPAGKVTLFATDTTSNACGAGCNLNGLSVPAMAGDDGEWELVFRLGTQGYEGIQSFGFRVAVDGLELTESMLGTVAVRAQQLCNAGQSLPGGNCGGSDKSWGLPALTQEPAPIPEPGIGALFGLGILGLLTGLRRRRV
ncbi:MAG TPA: PEP-CTERM sorting domain-containing protein [Burkholderiaceae bacterium]|nr:PEP-CTERM sorting domain-containing protein [Burkholderiaceae bacterium]